MNDCTGEVMAMKAAPDGKAPLFQLVASASSHHRIVWKYLFNSGTVALCEMSNQSFTLPE